MNLIKVFVLWATENKQLQHLMKPPVKGYHHNLTNNFLNTISINEHHKHYAIQATEYDTT